MERTRLFSAKSAQTDFTKRKATQYPVQESATSGVQGATEHLMTSAGPVQTEPTSSLIRTKRRSALFASLDAWSALKKDARGV